MLAAGLVALIGPILLLALYARTHFGGLVNSDAIDFAQIGRNLSDGRGVSTYVLRPLALTHGGDAMHQPDVTHGPLFPFILALAYGALGARDAVSADVSALFYVLAIPVIYRLGARLFGRTVALASALAFAYNPLSLEYALSGLNITLYVFLTTALLSVMSVIAAQNWSEGAKRSVRGAYIMAGVLTGLLYLTDPVFIWIAPVVLAAAWSYADGARARAVAPLLIAFAIVALPWMWRNGAVTGNPVFGLRGYELWMDTPNHYPGFSAYRLEPGSMVAGAGLMKGVVVKALTGAAEILQTLPQSPASWVLAFFLPGLFYRFHDASVGRIRALTVWFLVALVCGSVIFSVSMPLFVSLVPALLVFAIGFVAQLIRQSDYPIKIGRVTAAGLAGTLALPLIADFASGPSPASLAEVPAARYFGRIAPASAVGLSDQPWLIAWYADRPCVLIPQSDQHVGELRRQFPELRWMFLTKGAGEYSDAWLYLQNTFQNWNIVAARMQEQHKPPIPPLRINASAQPLLHSLEGFATVPPGPGSMPSAVIAVVPEASSPDEHHPRQASVSSND